MRREVPCQTHNDTCEQDQQEWPHLKKKSLLIFLLLLSSPSPLSSLCLLLMISCSLLIDTSSKEHVENVVRIEVILICSAMIPLLVLLLIILFGTSLIVDGSLFRVAETHESLIDFLESLFSLRIPVFIRMHLE